MRGDVNINIQYKITLIKWTIQNYFLSLINKEPTHYPTPQFLHKIKNYKLDKYIILVNNSYMIKYIECYKTCKDFYCDKDTNECTFKKLCVAGLLPINKEDVIK